MVNPSGRQIILLMINEAERGRELWWNLARGVDDRDTRYEASAVAPLRVGAGDAET
jgi:hypothetical protein